MKLGFVGSGKMASALVQGVTQSGALAPGDVLVSDVIAATAQRLATVAGVAFAETNADLVAMTDALVLCVKPYDALEALRSLRAGAAEKLVISIVAGLTLATLQEAAGPAVRIVRVMPNTPALVHKGAAAYALGATATAEDAALTEKIFGAVGEVVCVKEPLLDVVTGLSGSGPAYIYVVIEALADAGVLMGLPRELSQKLAAQTVAGAAEMVLKTGRHPAALKDEVASPGGTTIAGLEALEAAGMRSAFISAVRAATERAVEIGRAG
ncbi:MAG: pyrroline-5-carboxylate reductase [Chthoniobacter sp.]|nr:pyrroline-5-carboxylate reductase [Chthoniobacter sp.]